MKIKKRKKLERIPFAKTFVVNGGIQEEQCNATGYEVLIDGEWWNEYQDQRGQLHYGR